MRALLVLALVVPAAVEAKRGPWGEDPTLVPDFAPVEERRAPKVPAGDALYRSYAAAREVGPVDGALLVCHVEVARAHGGGIARGFVGIFTLGTLDGPDLTARLKLRQEPAAVLWGPAGHWQSYVSWPAVRLAPGDRVEVALADRHFNGTEGMGRAAVRWDGRTPLALAHGHWTLSCAVLTADEAAQAAAPWLASVDKQLDAIERAPAAPTELGFGYPGGAIGHLKAPLREAFNKDGNLRYAAGFYGWEHPEIQARLGRLRAAEATWAERRREAVAAQLAALPAPGTALAGEEATVRVEDVRCAAAQRARPARCGVRLGLEWPAGPDDARAPSRCAQARRMAEATEAVDAGGASHDVKITAFADDRAARVCGRDDDAGVPATMTIEAPAGSELLGNRRWTPRFARLR